MSCWNVSPMECLMSGVAVTFCQSVRGALRLVAGGCGAVLVCGAGCFVMGVSVEGRTGNTPCISRPLCYKYFNTSGQFYGVRVHEAPSLGAHEEGVFALDFCLGVDVGHLARLGDDALQAQLGHGGAEVTYPRALDAWV